MKHILITGGFGFIGSWLVERLLAEGHAVHVVDNLQSQPDLPQLFSEWEDIADLSFSVNTVAEYCRKHEQAHLPAFDAIYHLASPVGPAGVLDYAGQIVQTVVQDAYAVMRLAMQCGARLVDVSTSEVYGGGQGGYCSEEMPRVIIAESSARLEYAVAKLAAETAIINTCATQDLQAVIVRPFNVAGPRQSGKGGFVLPRFVEQAMRGEALTVFGDGQQVRAFTDVRDIIDGLLLAMERGQNGQVYNLGNPANKTTILELAKRVQWIVGNGRLSFTSGQTIYGERYREAANKYPNSEKAARELGWQPHILLDETIRDVWHYLKWKAQGDLKEAV